MASREIKLTQSETAIEQAAIDARRSMPKAKSDRGYRNTRLTVLIPDSLHDELKLYAKGTNQSMGEIVNKALEELIAKKDVQARIEQTRTFYKDYPEGNRCR